MRRGIAARPTRSVVKLRRNEGKTVMITPRNKNVKFQKDKLIADGYTVFKDYFKNSK